jgi:hypothetical protein
MTSYVFEAVNDLPIIFIHHPRRWSSLNRLVKASIGTSTSMSTCPTIVKLND